MTKTLGTCPYCFRSIAVNAHGKICSHGFKLVVGGHAIGFRSGVCNGSGHLSYEVSCEGTQALVDECVTHIAWLEHSLETSPDIMEVSSHGKVYGRDHLMFPVHLGQYQNRIKAQLVSTARTLAAMQEKVTEWKAV